MNEIYSCLVEKHAPGLVAIAALVCLCAVTVSLGLAARSRLAAGWARGAWLVAAGLVAGTGIWATHFVAMLAWRPGLPIAYDPALTMLSILIAVVGSILGFGLPIA
jgi:diguanylate cyclase